MRKPFRMISVRKALKHERRAMKKSSGTDLERIDATRDEDIDVSEIPALAESFFKRASIRNAREEAKRDHSAR